MLQPKNWRLMTKTRRAASTMPQMGADDVAGEADEARLDQHNSADLGAEGADGAQDANLTAALQDQRGEGWFTMPRAATSTAMACSAYVMRKVWSKTCRMWRRRPWLGVTISA